MLKRWTRTENEREFEHFHHFSKLHGLIALNLEIDLLRGGLEISEESLGCVKKVKMKLPADQVIKKLSEICSTLEIYNPNPHRTLQNLLLRLTSVVIDPFKMAKFAST